MGGALNVIQGRARMMGSGDVPRDDLARNAKIIEEQSNRIVDLLRRTLAFLGREGSVSVPVDVASLSRSAAELASCESSLASVSIELEVEAAHAVVSANPGRLLVAVSHLLRNAVESSAPGSSIALRVRDESVVPKASSSGAEVPFVALEVEDRGPGIPEEVEKRLFKPFTTTKDAGAGVGLGLFVAQAVAKEHGGWIEASSTPEGTRFTLHLPKGASSGT